MPQGSAAGQSFLGLVHQGETTPPESDLARLHNTYCCVYCLLYCPQDPVTGCPTPWCLSVLADIAAGLAALHERQIVHRDLKPHNVLLTEAGRAKLSDMGLSKQLVSEQSSFESHGSGERGGGAG
jgi:hypothetical protein